MTQAYSSIDITGLNLIHHFVIHEGNIISIDKNKNLIVNNKKVKFIGAEISLNFSFLRSLDNGSILLVDGELENEENAWIISTEGVIMHRFFIGNGIYRIDIQYNKIIACYCYCEERCSLGKNNMAIFNFDGSVYEVLNFDNCVEVKAIYPYQENKILIAPFPLNTLLLIDLESMEITEVDIDINVIDMGMNIVRSINVIGSRIILGLEHRNPLLENTVECHYLELYEVNKEEPSEIKRLGETKGYGYFVSSKMDCLYFCNGKDLSYPERYVVLKLG